MTDDILCITIHPFMAVEQNELLDHPERLTFWSPITQSCAELTAGEKKKAADLLIRAAEAKAVPYQSNFFVLTGIAVAPGPWLSQGDTGVLTAGNYEYGLSNGIHGEEAAVSRVLATYGRVPIEAIAFYDPDPAHSVNKDTDAAPCGACRDKLMPYCSPDMMFIQGGVGDMVSITHFRDYLFGVEQFEKVDPTRLDQIGWQEAAYALENGIGGFLPPEMKKNLYGAAIVAQDGTVWASGHYTNAGYDAVDPILGAIEAWRSSPKEGVRKLVLVGANGLPDPLYSGRQAILELWEGLNQRTGNRFPLPVEHINIDPQTGLVTGAALTNSAILLPHPFSAGTFDMQDALTDYTKLLDRPKTPQLFIR